MPLPTIYKGDLDNSIASKLRGHHVSYIIAPVEAKNNEMFLRQADCCTLQSKV